ncbi:hypothetical protein TKK_0016051 [Trichogramma kaykai]
MLCGSQFYISSLKDSTPPLFVDGAQLQTRPELTILGLKLTPSLSWGTQKTHASLQEHLSDWFEPIYSNSTNTTGNNGVPWNT